MEKIETEFSLTDAEYEAFSTDRGDLTILLKSWDDAAIQINFTAVIRFSYKLGDTVSGLFKDAMGNEFLKEAIARCYSVVPEKHPYTYFSLVDIQNFPFLEIVAENFTICKF